MSEVNQQHHGEVKFLITYNNDPYIVDLLKSMGLTPLSKLDFTL